MIGTDDWIFHGQENKCRRNKVWAITCPPDFRVSLSFACYSPLDWYIYTHWIVNPVYLSSRSNFFFSPKCLPSSWEMEGPTCFRGLERWRIHDWLFIFYWRLLLLLGLRIHPTRSAVGAASSLLVSSTCVPSRPDRRVRITKGPDGKSRCRLGADWIIQRKRSRHRETLFVVHTSYKSGQLCITHARSDTTVAQKSSRWNRVLLDLQQTDVTRFATLCPVILSYILFF